MISIHMTTAKRFQSGLLKKAVDSVLNQSFRDFEFIICDDASEDGTASYLEELAQQDSRVRVFRNERNVNSVAISLGRCMLAASPQADLITWMFDDSELRPDALKQLNEALEEDPDLDFVFGHGICHLRDGNIFRVGDKNEDFIRENVARNSTLVPNAAILLHRRVFERFGWYDSSVILRRSCDWDLFRRIIKGGARFKVLHIDMVDEYGEIEMDSLRNSFTTTFEIMEKFCVLREQHGWSLSLQATQYHPVDRIPSGDWTQDELALLHHMLIEYFISVGNISKAFQHAERLSDVLPGSKFFVERLRHQARHLSPIEGTGLMGAFAGILSNRHDMVKRTREAEQRIDSLQARIDELEGALRAPRYRLADRLNNWLKSLGSTHRILRGSAKLVRQVIKGAT